MDIIAEDFADAARQPRHCPAATWGQSCPGGPNSDPGASRYTIYYDFREPVAKIPPHRVLAINRGNGKNFSKFPWTLTPVPSPGTVAAQFQPQRDDAAQYVRQAMEDGYQRLLAPAVERDIRRQLTEMAHAAAKLFSANLTSLLLQPPTRGKTVLGSTPYRTGCKLAVVDPTGKLLAVDVIYPTPPHNQVEASGARSKSSSPVRRQRHCHRQRFASRETTEFIGELTQELDGVSYTVVDESGASVYSVALH